MKPETSAALSSGRIMARLDRLPASRSLWAMVVLLSLGAFFEFLELFSTSYVLPGMIDSGILQKSTEHFFSLNGAAAYIAATFIGLFLGVVAFSPLTDKLGRRTTFTYALLLYSFSSVVMALQNDAVSLNFWRLITGIGLGLEMVTIDSYVSELVPTRMRGRAFAVNKVISYLAMPTVALLAFLLVPLEPLGFEGWRWVVLISALGALVVWFIRMRLPESPRWLVSRGRLEEADRVVRILEEKVARDVGGTLPPAAESEPQATVIKGHFSEMWQGRYLTRTVMLIIFHAAQAIGLYGFSHWMPTFLVEQGATLSDSLEFSVLIACMAPFGPLLAVLFVDRFERKSQIVMAALVVAVAGLVFINLRTPLPIILTGGIITIGATILSLNFHAYQTELYPTRIRARAVGFVYSVSRISGAISGFLIAFAMKHAGVPGALLTICGSMVVVMLSIGLMGPRTRGRSLEEVSP